MMEDEILDQILDNKEYETVFRISTYIIWGAILLVGILFNDSPALYQNVNKLRTA